MKRKITITMVLTAAVAGALGFAAGRLGGDGSVPAAAMPAADAVQTTTASPAGRDAEPIEAPATLPEAPPSEASRGGETTVLKLLELDSEFEQTAGLYGLLADADVAAIERHLADVPKIPKLDDRRGAYSILFLRYADLDPVAALAAVREGDPRERQGAVYSMFNAWAKHDLERALDELTPLVGHPFVDVAAQAIISAHGNDPTVVQAVVSAINAGGAASGQQLANAAGHDPERAFDEALTLPPAQRDPLLNAIAQRWGQLDAERALERSVEIPHVNARRGFRLTVVGTAASLDPEFALTFIEGAEDQQEATQMTQHVFRLLAQRDAAGAFRRAADLPSPQLRRSGLEAALSLWARHDARSAGEALLTLDDTRMVRELGHQLIQSYVTQAPREALAWAEVAEGRVGDLWVNALSQFAREDPEEAMATLRELPPSPVRARAEAQVIGSWAESDPERAAALALALPASQHRTQAIQNVAQWWARQAPEEAFDWTLRLDEPAQAQVIGNVGRQVAEADPQLARRLTDRLAGIGLAQWMDSVLWMLTRADPEATASWPTRYVDEPGYGQWVGTVATPIAQDDPELALSLLTTIRAPGARAGALRNVLHGWAGQVPAAVAAWLDRAGDVAAIAEPDSWSIVASAWVQFDPTAARRWALGLPDGTRRDNAISGIASTLRGDGEGILELLDELSSAQKRAELVQQHAHQLFLFDPEAGEAFVHRAGLEPEFEAQLLEGLRQSVRHRYPGVVID